MIASMTQITHHQIRLRVLKRRSDIVKLPGGLIMLNMIINRQYDISDMLAIEEQLDEATNFPDKACTSCKRKKVCNRRLPD